MNFAIEIEQEEDGRWLAEVIGMPGVLAYGEIREQAVAKVQALALRVLADKLEHGEVMPDLLSVSFVAALVNSDRTFPLLPSCH
ncbi:type II toxin-antitoxin system HicB family antitoxin [Aerosakkonemataceae cyanobacterium BLCC-F154]|uniref:Type II toxin-antitoxin system HicB family antitoxin n=1 Tax=Floridaenema fluviatile BLCC-F154 TaxID=3153640 RepID=A0ABV4YDQ7_9CYAN